MRHPITITCRLVPRNPLLILIGICALGYSSAAGAPVPPLLAGLSAGDQEKVLEGQQVLITNNIEGMAWPETVIFRKFQVSPEKVAAAFTNYAQLPEINPTVISASQVSGSGTDQVVDYKTKVPVLNNVTYTLRNRISRKSDGVTIRWTLLKSSCTSTGNGEIVIEPVKGGSILKYESRVNPSFPGASLLRSTAISQASDTVNYVAAYLNRVTMR